MSNLQRKNYYLRFTRSKLFIFIFFVLIIFFALEIINLFDRMKETERNKEIVQKRVIDLQKRKDKLIRDIDKLKTESGIEENIRDKFGLVKDGESMILIIDDKKNNKTQ